jgi:hypothetical protein
MGSAHLRPGRRHPLRLLVFLAVAFSLASAASATAGLRPDPRPKPLPQAPPPPPPRSAPAPAAPQQPPPPAVKPPSRAGPARPPKKASIPAARRRVRPAPIRGHRDPTMVRRAAPLATLRPTRREVVPLTFSESRSKVWPVLILATLVLASALVVFGYRLRPAHSTRWPLASRFLEQRAELLVLSGLVMLAVCVTWLLLFLIAPIA